jgi:hypothetical protein
VVTDGLEDWDNPAPWNRRTQNRNYFLRKGGRYALYRGELIRLRRKFPPSMIVTNIDGTLFERNQTAKDALVRFHRFWIKYYLFTPSVLVYNTGRHLSDFLAIKAEGFELPNPNFLIAGLGSEIYRFNSVNGDYVLDV